MTTFWNAGQKSKIEGLDILNLRAIDQSIEQRRVGGITTVSFRARYFSFLPWILGEFYQKQLSEKNRATFNWDLLIQTFARLEIVVIAATQIGRKKGENGEMARLVGARTHEKILEEFENTGKVSLLGTKEGTFQNAYWNPCVSFGILGAESEETGLPATLPPRRGGAIYDVRHKTLNPNGITKIILEGGVLTKKELLKEYQHFSINGISSNPQEKALLVEAFTKPFDEASEEYYRLFNETQKWALRAIKNKLKNATDIIDDNYEKTLKKLPEKSTQIELDWAEYELRRRVHFALEIMLAAMTTTLQQIKEGIVEDIVAEWEEDTDIAPVIEEFFPKGIKSFNQHVNKITSSIPDYPFVNDFWKMTPSSKALYALAILISCKNMSSNIRKAGILKERAIPSYMTIAFELIDKYADKKVRDLLPQMLVQCVAEPHLRTTLRKMGQGQECSLRFYLEGAKLHATGVGVKAGYSGDRLTNVLIILNDLGISGSDEDGYTFTAESNKHLEVIDEG